MTATFKILSGKSLKNAIAGYGKTVATFSQKTHQLAFSAINHVDDHSCASHINSLYQATPQNYRGALRKWACHFGKVKFVTESMTFEYNKSAKSDLVGALETSPAEFQKATSKTANRAPTPLIERLEKLVDAELGKDNGDHDMAKKLKNFITAQKAPALEVVKKPKKAAPKPAPVKTLPAPEAAADQVKEAA